jgi:hypothetical protein
MTGKDQVKDWARRIAQSEPLKRLQGGRVRLSAVVVVLVAVGVIVWLEAATETGKPVYWAGPQPGTELELSRPSKDRTYVRYLTGGAEAGDPQPDFLTVGTYAFPNAVSALRKQSTQPGGVLASAPGGATVYFNRNAGQSVYLAYPGVDVEIEVYDPNPRRALQLVSSGQIVPVD